MVAELHQILGDVLSKRRQVRAGLVGAERRQILFGLQLANNFAHSFEAGRAHYRRSLPRRVSARQGSIAPSSTTNSRSTSTTTPWATYSSRASSTTAANSTATPCGWHCSP